MTIERTAGASATIASLLLLWFCVTAIITVKPGVTSSATIVFPTTRLMNALPEGVLVLNWGAATANVTSDNPDFVQKLYAAGAVLIFPTRKSSCLDLGGLKS